MSKILSSTYDYLDNVHTREDKQILKEKNRNSISDWPDLEYTYSTTVR